MLWFANAHRRLLSNKKRLDIFIAGLTLGFMFAKKDDFLDCDSAVKLVENVLNGRDGR